MSQDLGVIQLAEFVKCQNQYINPKSPNEDPHVPLKVKICERDRSILCAIISTPLNS